MTERLPPPDASRFPELTAHHLRTLPEGTLLGRIHFTEGEHPSSWNAFRSFGPTSCRFDHHDGDRGEHPTRAILYAAPVVDDVDGKPVPPLDTCLVEVFRDTGVVDVTRGGPYFALFRISRALRLLDLVDSNWVTLAGANAAISSGSRSAAREWSKAIYDRYSGSDLDGLIYGCSNMPRGRSMALYERARSALNRFPELDLPLAGPALFGDVEVACSELGLELI